MIKLMGEKMITIILSIIQSYVKLFIDLNIEQSQTSTILTVCLHHFVFCREQTLLIRKELYNMPLKGAV